MIPYERLSKVFNLTYNFEQSSKEVQSTMSIFFHDLHTSKNEDFITQQCVPARSSVFASLKAFRVAKDAVQGSRVA